MIKRKHYFLKQKTTNIYKSNSDSLMGKKYQVFISSTYIDLIDERREVMEALLQMNCFPVGMEYFNASDESQWEIIKKLIEDCDYYVLIIAGRYGSLDESTGKSYTQMEFEYAVSQNKTVLRFVYDNIGNLKADFVENTDEGKAKLCEFRKEVVKKYCKMWNSTEDLKAQIILALTNQFNTNPQIGWVKADTISSEQANKDIIRLREENEKLKQQISYYEGLAPTGIEHLSQGEDTYELDFSYWKNYTKYHDATIEFTWNEIFSYLAPYMISEYLESGLKKKLEEMIEIKFGDDISNVNVLNEDFQNIKVQLIALGLIEESIKKRSTKDTGVYWTLTKYGNKQMFILKAIKK